MNLRLLLNRSELDSVKESFTTVVNEIQATITNYFKKSKESNIENLKKFLSPIMQDLLFLNIFLTFHGSRRGSFGVSAVVKRGSQS